MTVAVVGGGVIGLTTGVLLLQSGVGVRLYAESMGEAIASSAACAMWLPFLMSASDAAGPESREEVNESRHWADVSWRKFELLSQRPDTGVTIGPWSELFATRVERPYYADVVYNFREEPFHRGTTDAVYAWHFETFIIEMSKYLPWLGHEFRRLGGECIERRISRFPELDEPVIFNCTGLGARELCADKGFRPIKGQLLLHPPLALTRAFGHEKFCVIPRSGDLALGSLFLEDDESMDEDVAGSDYLWSTAQQWADTEFGSEIGLNGQLAERPERVLVGIRPFRPDGVRHGREVVSSKVVYHDYGHGGSGVTFSWGCATSAVQDYEGQLRRELLQVSGLRPAATCDVSIEVGHFEMRDLAEPSWEVAEAAIRTSMKRARQLTDVLIERGQSYSLCILVDDKQLKSGSRAALAEQMLSRLHGLGIDYMCLETRLVDAVPSLRRVLPQRIATAIEKRRSAGHGLLTCDQDILLWYALRLGLADKAACGVRSISTGATSQGRPFEANRVASFLGGQFQEPERKAQRLLRSAFGPEIASACSPIFV